MLSNQKLDQLIASLADFKNALVNKLNSKRAEALTSVNADKLENKTSAQVEAELAAVYTPHLNASNPHNINATTLNTFTKPEVDQMLVNRVPAQFAAIDHIGHGGCSKPPFSARIDGLAEGHQVGGFGVFNDGQISYFRNHWRGGAGSLLTTMRGNLDPIEYAGGGALDGGELSLAQNDTVKTSFAVVGVSEHFALISPGPVGNLSIVRRKDLYTGNFLFNVAATTSAQLNTISQTISGNLGSIALVETPTRLFVIGYRIDYGTSDTLIVNSLRISRNGQLIDDLSKLEYDTVAATYTSTIISAVGQNYNLSHATIGGAAASYINYVSRSPLILTEVVGDVVNVCINRECSYYPNADPSRHFIKDKETRFRLNATTGTLIGTVSVQATVDIPESTGSGGIIYAEPDPFGLDGIPHRRIGVKKGPFIFILCVPSSGNNNSTGFIRLYRVRVPDSYNGDNPLSIYDKDFSISKTFIDVETDEDVLALAGKAVPIGVIPNGELINVMRYNGGVRCYATAPNHFTNIVDNVNGTGVAWPATITKLHTPDNMFAWYSYRLGATAGRTLSAARFITGVNNNNPSTGIFSTFNAESVTMSEEKLDELRMMLLNLIPANIRAAQNVSLVDAFIITKNVNFPNIAFLYVGTSSYSSVWNAVANAPIIYMFTFNSARTGAVTTITNPVLVETCTNSVATGSLVDSRRLVLDPTIIQNLAVDKKLFTAASFDFSDKCLINYETLPVMTYDINAGYKNCLMSTVVLKRVWNSNSPSVIGGSIDVTNVNSTTYTRGIPHNQVGNYLDSRINFFTRLTNGFVYPGFSIYNDKVGSDRDRSVASSVPFHISYDNAGNGIDYYYTSFRETVVAPSKFIEFFYHPFGVGNRNDIIHLNGRLPASFKGLTTTLTSTSNALDAYRRLRLLTNFEWKAYFGKHQNQVKLFFNESPVYDNNGTSVTIPDADYMVAEKLIYGFGGGNYTASTTFKQPVVGIDGYIFSEIPWHGAIVVGDWNTN